MNAHSTHRSAIWLSVVFLTLLSATAVFADGPEGRPPQRPYKPEPISTRSPVPPPSPEVKPPTPEPRTDTPIGPVTTPTQPPRPDPKSNVWWWITASILLLLFLFFLFWILRRKQTGYAKPPSTPTPPAYPPIDQSRQQTRPDQY